MLDESIKNFFPGKPAHIPTVHLKYKRLIDAELISTISQFLRSSLDEFSVLGLTKIMVGLSGGLDSVICCALLKESLGEKASAIIVALEESDGYNDDVQFSI